jgi:pyruvate formate lyase activating enzyme
MNISDPEPFKARYWEAQGDRVRCQLCPHHCRVADRHTGICGVRENRGGAFYALTYGKASAVHIDPIEKKPLYHFHPGEEVLSLGSVGCNLGCQHCQNYAISQARPDSMPLQYVGPEEVAQMCLESGCPGVAWTYNEPSMWQEYVVDASKDCKAKGLFTVLVTNGYVEEGPLREMCGCIDAMNIDVKGFTEGFYHKICKAKLEPVLRTCEVAHAAGVHIELTYLIITTKNDSEEEMRAFCEWCAKLGKEVPVHFSRFHPDYMMMDVPPTPLRTMEKALALSKEAGLKHVYAGNISLGKGEDTVCPQCGALAISRHGFRIKLESYKAGNCAKCGASLDMVP